MVTAAYATLRKKMRCKNESYACLFKSLSQMVDGCVRFLSEMNIPDSLVASFCDILNLNTIWLHQPWSCIAYLTHNSLQ